MQNNILYFQDFELLKKLPTKIQVIKVFISQTNEGL